MSSDPTEGRLGYSRPSHARMMVRSHAYNVAVAEEMGEWWLRVQTDNLAHDAVGGPRPSALERRVERSHMEDAALEIYALVERLPRPVRDVVVLRSSGSSWRDISRALPDRVYFSLADDWLSALRRVWQDGSHSVRRLV